MVQCLYSGCVIVIFSWRQVQSTALLPNRQVANQIYPGCWSCLIQWRLRMPPTPRPPWLQPFRAMRGTWRRWRSNCHRNRLEIWFYNQPEVSPRGNSHSAQTKVKAIPHGTHPVIRISQSKRPQLFAIRPINQPPK